MRDADRIREQSPSSQSRGTVLMTLAAVVGVCGVFAMGYSIGRRVQRLVPCQAAPTRTARAPVGLDFAGSPQDEMTFYETLMADRAPADTGAKAPAGRPAVGDAPEGDRRPSAPAKSASRTFGRRSGRAQAATDPAGNFTLQVSSVRRRDEAQALATAMTRQGLHPYITAASLGGRGTWYRVRVGHYDNMQQARAAREHLAEADIPARVMHID